MVRAAQDGDAEAFRVIYRALSPVVHGYLRAKGVSDPEGTTSEVFLTLLPRLNELRGGAAGLRTFVMSVAHARMVDDQRRQARRLEHLEYDPRTDTRMAASAEHEALSVTERQRLTGLLARLPADQAEVIVLRFVADLSLEGVAAVLGRSVGAVKQLQRRGLLALRALLEPTTAMPE
jgi:RNA polymerase sigma-70 factor (ECF subfamily)